MSLQLRNPHSVMAVFQNRPQDVLEVRILGARPHGAWGDVAAQSQAHGIRVAFGGSPGKPTGGGSRQRQRKSPDAGGRSGGGEAVVREHSGVDLATLFKRREGASAGEGLWLALDQLQDPHNVGAIFRTAAFLGVAGIVLTKDASAPLNSTVYDVASGGVDGVPFSLQTNLSRALDVAKEAGIWVLGTSEHATTDVSQIDRGRPWLMVVGNEEKGLRRLTLSKCDEVCRITQRGPVDSLNVSVATGIMIAALTPPLA